MSRRSSTLSRLRGQSRLDLVCALCAGRPARRCGPAALNGRDKAKTDRRFKKALRRLGDKSLTALSNTLSKAVSCPKAAILIQLHPASCSCYRLATILTLPVMAGFCRDVSGRQRRLAITAAAELRQQRSGSARKQEERR